jgi:hypothetical protein
LHYKYPNHRTLETVYTGVSIKSALPNRSLAECLEILFTPLLFWSYLLTNRTMGATYRQQKPWRSQHLSTDSSMMRHKPHFVLIDRVGLVVVLSLSLLCVYYFGLAKVFCYYIGPLLVQQAYLIAITTLHHGDMKKFSRYPADKWSFEKGVELT